MSVTPDAYTSGHEGWLAYQRHNFFIVEIVFLCALQFPRLLQFCEWLKLYLCIIRMGFAYFFPPLATMSIFQCTVLMVGFTSALLTSVPQTSVSPVGGTASPGHSGRRAGLKLEFRSRSLASRWEEAANSSFPMWAWMTGIMPCTCMVLLRSTCVRALKGEQVLTSCCWGAVGADWRELQPLQLRCCHFTEAGGFVLFGSTSGDSWHLYVRTTHFMKLIRLLWVPGGLIAGYFGNSPFILLAFHVTVTLVVSFSCTSLFHPSYRGFGWNSWEAVLDNTASGRNIWTWKLLSCWNFWQTLSTNKRTGDVDFV